jgi:uncharacterized HAD superfamily protein
MKIGVDLDDVLCDFVPAMFRFHNKTYGTHLTRKAFSEDIHALFEVIADNTEDAIKKVEAFYRSDEFMKLKPIEGARENLLKIKSAGHKPVVITARPSHLKDHTEKWLGEHFKDIFEEIHFADKAVHDRGWSKSEMCKRLEIHTHIDDFLMFAEDCAKHGINVFLLDKPWNQMEKLEEKIRRVFSWDEISEQLA